MELRKVVLVASSIIMLSLSVSGQNGAAISLDQDYSLVSIPSGQGTVDRKTGQFSYFNFDVQLAGGPYIRKGEGEYLFRDTVNPTGGYYIKAEKEVGFGAPSQDSQTFKRSVRKGWNTISVPGGFQLQAEPLNKKEAKLGECKISSGPWKWSQENGYELVIDKPLDPSKGYWIKAVGSCTLSFGSSDDGDDDPTVSGQLSLEFEEIPGSPNVRETPLVKLLSEDGRDVSVSGNDGESIGFGSLGLTYTPSYEDESKQIGEIECNPNDPRTCSLTVNGGGGIDFSFPSPGTNTFEATAVAGDGVENSVTQEVDVGVGQPPNPVDLEFSGIDGDYGGDWEPALDEDWDEPDYQTGSTEKLAFVKDEFDNVVIDTGNSYLYGGAFLQKEYFGDEDGLLKLEYRLRVQKDDLKKANEFGIVTDSGLNSTVDLNSMSGVDLSNSIDQTGKRYSLTFDLSKISEGYLSVGVFPTPGFLQSDGGGDSGNGLRLIMEDISVVGGRDVEFQRTRPDNLNLVRGEESTIKYEVTDSLDQFDLAKMNVSYELNPQENSGKTEISDKRCSAKSSGFCRLQFDFTPQELGEYNFTVGLETKTGKYFSKEYNYVSRPTSEPNDISWESGLGDNGLFFKWIDGYDSPDLYGKKVNAYKCVDGSFAEEPEPENRCRANERCFVPGPEGGSDFSGYYNITLNTEDQEKVIDHLTVSLDTQKTSCP